MLLARASDVTSERRFRLMAKGVRIACELNAVRLKEVLLAPRVA